jgi:hypothetical protein
MRSHSCKNVSGHLGEQAPHVRPFDANTEYDFGRPVGAKQVDFRLSRPGDMDVRRFVILRVDDKPKTVSAMDDNHSFI